jgi:hypothetical protein
MLTEYRQFRLAPTLPRHVPLQTPLIGTPTLSKKVVLPLNRGLTFDLESNFPSRGLTSALDWTDKHRKQ